MGALGVVGWVFGLGGVGIEYFRARK